MQKYITLALCLLVFLGAQAQIDRSVQPKAGPAPEINLTKPKTFTLHNGLKVMVVENHKLPRVTTQLVIDNPPILEGDKAGVSSLTASLLGNGSTNIPKDAYNEEVDYLGAFISFGSQSATARSLSKYFPRILELMADAALHPNFTQEELDKEKEILLTGIKSQEKDVSAIASRVQAALAYGSGHPYGEFVTENSVKNITLSDIQKFYSDYFVPANAYLVVIGDVKFNDVKKLVKKEFEAWPKGSPPAQNYQEAAKAPNTQIDFVDVPNAVQSEIAIQNLSSLKMADADYLPALLANQILGGGAQARLFLNLREDKAYTYGSYSSLGDDKYAPALFQASASVRNAVTDSSVVEILTEMDRLVNTPVSAEELKNAKAKYMGNFVMALENPGTIANFELNIETENLPHDFYKTYLERIEAVTVADVQAAAQKHIQPGNAQIVVAGKGSDVLENLQKVTFKGQAVPVMYYDKYAQPSAKPEYGGDVPEGLTAETVIQNYFKAIGGLDKINAVNSLLISYEGSAMGATIKTEEKRTADKFLQTTYMNENALMGVVANGDEIYMKQGGNKVPLPGGMAQDLEYAIGIFPEQGILKSGKAKLAGIEDVDGKKAYKIEVPGESVQASYYYDVETGYKIKEASVINVNGQTQNQETLLSDYKEMEGIKFPATKISTMGPQNITTSLVKVIINKEVSATDFE